MKAVRPLEDDEAIGWEWKPCKGWSGPVLIGRGLDLQTCPRSEADWETGRMGKRPKSASESEAEWVTLTAKCSRLYEMD